MGISVIGKAASGGGGGGGGDFVINTGDYSSDTAELSTEYAAGAYGITASPTDSTLDIYLVASDGSFAGYTNTGSITATIPFDKVVVLGATSNTSLSFIFNGESQTTTTKGQLVGAGAFVSSVGTSSLPSVNDTTVVNGGNFAADVEVSFIDQNSIETAAKAVVRSSATQLIVTRPDVFSTAASPFTLKVVNPGIPVPAETNAHLLSNSITAGTNPVWVTDANIYLGLNEVVSLTLLATDTEGSNIDYSVVSGALLTGLTFDAATAVISGTLSYAAEASATLTIRATDAGGNFVDRAFNLQANSAPTWTTPASGVESAIVNTAYSFQLVASGGNAGGALTYTLQSGALLAGYSLSSSGVISGTSSGPGSDSATFTVRATDEQGLFVDREFNHLVRDPITASGGTVTTSGVYKYHTFTSSGTFSIDGGSDTIEYLVVAGGGQQGATYGGGGGAGGMLDGSLTAGAGSFTVIVGAANGGNSQFGSLLTANGGGRGSDYRSANASQGGSGGGNGGTSGVGAAGYSGQGFAGGGSNNEPASGGGGGAGGIGGNNRGNQGGNGGPGRVWVDGNYYAGGGAGDTGYSGQGVTGIGIGPGNGGAPRGTPAQAGIVIVRYAA